MSSRLWRWIMTIAGERTRERTVRLSTLAAGYALPRQRASVTPQIMLASAGLALINATTEEILWRGIYTAAFPDNLALG